MKKEIILNLRMFDGEGGGAAAGAGTGATGAEGTQTTGIQSTDTNSNSGSGNNGNAENANSAESLEKEWKELTGGKFKDMYKKSIQSAITDRFKAQSNEQANYKKEIASQKSLIDKIAYRYGIDASDLAAVEKALENDEHFYEARAIEQGMSVDQYKRVMNAEYESHQLRKAQEDFAQEQQRKEIFNSWMNQVPAVQQMYPSFDFTAEISNPNFRRLLEANIPVMTAYQVTHQDEIMGAAMQHAVQKTKQQVANNIAANGRRPDENGTSSGATAQNKGVDVHKMTKKERQALNKRAREGERITF